MVVKRHSGTPLEERVPWLYLYPVVVTFYTGGGRGERQEEGDKVS
jgi:hypothetical protein